MMNTRNSNSLFKHCISSIFISLTLLTCCDRLTAELPTINHDPWFGFFAGYDGSRSRFGVAGDGTLYYNHNNDELTNVGGGHPHRIHPTVEETLPNGTIITNRLLPETLETNEPATDKPVKTRYRGKVNNGVVIEVEVEYNRRRIRVSGRIVDDGEVKNPIRFALLTEAPPYYLLYREKELLANANADEKPNLEKFLDRLKNQASKEDLVLTRLDGKRIKQPLLEPAAFDSPGFNGDGFRDMDLDFQWLNGRRISFTTGRGSRMMLRSAGGNPVFKHGFSFICIPNPTMGNDATSELIITTR
jgi:hypothetical protein